MEMTYFTNTESMVGIVNKWCETHIRLFKAKSIFLPAGQTPMAIYANWESTHPDWLDEKILMQVDDVHSGKQKGMFKNFFLEHLPTYAPRILSPEQSGGQVADLAILGLGKNGHVAFHEPGLPESFFYGVIDLSDTTKNTLKLEPDAKGVTYGVGAFLQAKAILLIVSGAGKADAFHSFLTNTGNSPVNFLRDHPHLTVLADASLKPSDHLKTMGPSKSHLGRAH
jgi:6-phosphogluconolactonase/glucosamine-6-phosphate isomerase/deaminase